MTACGAKVQSVGAVLACLLPQFEGRGLSGLRSLDLHDCDLGLNEEFEKYIKGEMGGDAWAVEAYTRRPPG